MCLLGNFDMSSFDFFREHIICNGLMRWQNVECVHFRILTVYRLYLPSAVRFCVNRTFALPTCVAISACVSCPLAWTKQNVCFTFLRQQNVFYSFLRQQNIACVNITFALHSCVNRNLCYSFLRQQNACFTFLC
jgi:hypothetical protein